MNLQVMRGFLRQDRGNVSAIFALTLVPIVGLIGLGVDFTMGAKRKAQLDALADSAVLAAVTPSVLASNANAGNTSASSSIATTLFNSQVANVSGIGPITVTLSPTVTGSTTTMTLSYSTTVSTLFGNLVGKTQMPISGKASAAATLPPNIDFYLLLDDSPSMAIAATTAGINTMVANTPDQCAFGCHESDTSPNDYYGLARRLGVTLRMDLLSTAVQNLMTTAQNAATANNVTYRVSVNTFDTGLTNVVPLTSSLSSAAAKAKANLAIYEVGYQNQNNDEFTNWTSNITQMNTNMPNPGNGTNVAGDTPQEVLVIVTDGVEDQGVNGNRVQSLMSNSYCTTIKNRGIRIAVLYTEYLPLPTNSWYNTYISPFQPNIGSNLESCASPGLYTMVTTNGDISAALSSLFNTAVATAHLTQ